MQAAGVSRFPKLSPPGTLAYKTAAAYVRVSTDHQTVDNQKMELSKYAEANKLNIVNFYQDEAISGTVPPMDRPGFKALMDYIRANKVNHVLVFDLTRVGRTFWDTLVAIREIERYSQLISASSKDGFLNVGQESMRQIFISMLAWFAERERDMLIERINAGIARAKAQGIKLGRRDKPFSDVDVAQLLEYLKSKKTGPGQKMELAGELFGLSHPTLYRKLAKAGYITDNMTRIDAARLLDLLEAGVTNEAIGKALAVSTEDIAYALHRLNIYGRTRYAPGKIPSRPYCVVRFRPEMTIIRFRKYRKLRLSQ